ncbi:MAG: hypothetical protein ACE5OZ_01020 [Candidatus Heimdallarchaeota archaeon]
MAVYHYATVSHRRVNCWPEDMVSHMAKDAQLEKWLNAIVPPKGRVRFSTSAKIRALERAATLGVDITDELLQKNRDFLHQFLYERPPQNRRHLLRTVSSIIGKPSAQLLTFEANETQKDFVEDYGEEFLTRIRQLAGVQRKQQPDPRKDPGVYIRYWLRQAANRADFLTRLQILFPDYDENQLRKVLSVTAEGRMAGTREQMHFRSQLGQTLLQQILAKYRDFPTDPREWEKFRSRSRKRQLFFKKEVLQTMLEEAGSQAADAKTLKAFDQVLVEFALALVKEALQLMHYSQLRRKTLQGKDIELAISLKQEV